MKPLRALRAAVAVVVVVSTLVVIPTAASASGALTSKSLSLNDASDSTGGVGYTYGFTTATSGTFKRAHFGVPAGTIGQTPYLSLHGVSGNYASTPDSTTNSMPDDIDFRVKAALDNWTGGGTQTFVSKDNTKYSYNFYIDNSGYLHVDTSPNPGTSWITATSTSPVAFSSGQTMWVRGFRDTTNPAATGNDTYFATSSDGENWTALGTTVTNSGTTSIYNTTDNVEIGSTNGGTANLLSGKIYRAELYAANTPATAAVFDPTDDSASPYTSWTSSATSGETWTVHQSGANQPADIVSDLTASSVTGIPSGGTATLRYIDSVMEYNVASSSTVGSGVAATITLTGITNNATAGTYSSQIDTIADTTFTVIDTGSVSFTLTSSTYSSSWWDKRYGSRVPITVTSNDAIAGGYSVKVSLDHASLVSAVTSLSSGDDVRVVYWNGTTWRELDRTLVSGSAWNTSTTQLWFRTQASVLASTTVSNTYFVYYNNASAGSPKANGSNVFDLWDSFGLGTVDRVKWSTINPASGTISEPSGELSIAGSDAYANSSIFVGLTTTLSFTPGVAIESDFRVPTMDATTQANWKANVGVLNAYWIIDSAGSTTKKTRYFSGSYFDLGPTVMQGNPVTSHHTNSYIDSSGNGRYLEDGQVETSRSVSTSAFQPRLTFSPDNSTSTDHTAWDARYDNFMVRKYVPNEPTAAAGFNQAPSTPSGIVQYKSDGTTVIAQAGYNNSGTTIFSGTVSDADLTDTEKLCVEVETIATAFTNSDTACSTGFVTQGTVNTVSVGSLTGGTSYHWQVRTKDAAGLYSPWQHYGTNNDVVTADADFTIDLVNPTGGTVWDGTTASTETRSYSGSVTSLSANWGVGTDALSGVASYLYAIGTTQGGTDIRSWTASATNSVTATGLSLSTGQVYFFSVETIDNAGNTSSAVNSTGQVVQPTLTFGFTSSAPSYHLNAGNTWLNTNTDTLSISTNAHGGYQIRMRETQTPLNASGPTSLTTSFAGSWASPSTVSGTGFAYTSDDTSVGGSNRFSGGTLFAAVPTSSPGDIVADQPALSNGATYSDTIHITYDFFTNSVQNAGAYNTNIIYTVIPTF